MSNERSGLLVTGSHRSGSTWLGRMLASADELHYVQEPFNIVAWQRWLTPRPTKQFVYLDDRNGGPYEAGVRRVVELRYPLISHLAAGPSTKMARRAIRITIDATRARRRGAMPLVKDPMALFSCEWLHDRFGLQPILLVREPVAFVGSLKERDWTFDFNHWVGQPRLLAEIAAPWADQIRSMADRPGDIVNQGILQWNVFYDFVADLRRRRPDTIVLSYERLALEPMVEMAALFERLALPFGAHQRAQIENLTTAGGGTGEDPVTGAGTSAIDVHRRSRDELETWRRRLTEEEAAAVRAGTAPVAERLARSGRQT